ncbi:MAG: hypothetical protein HLX50_14600 [Alteromonadaceae bacterium]|nr:hypothetical protein [Alteromonadaceae bacterium]
MKYKVERTQHFLEHHYYHMSEIQQKALLTFVKHVMKSGLGQLPGKLKKSDNVPLNEPNRDRRIKTAKDYNLYHYHLGTPCWEESENGCFKTSDDVIIFSKKIDKKAGLTRVILVGFSSHPVELPFPQDMAEVANTKHS